MLGLRCWEGFAVVESEAYSVVVVCSLTAVVSLVAEHRLEGTQASIFVPQGLSCGSWALECSLRSCGAWA